MWKKLLIWLDSWEPLQRFECWRDEALGRRVDECPESFRWVEGIPQRRKDLVAARLTGNTPWEGWRNWASKWIEPQS